MQPLTEGMAEEDAKPQDHDDQRHPEALPPQLSLPARPSNRPRGKHILFTHLRKTPIAKNTISRRSQELHAEGILKVEKTGYHKQQLLETPPQRVTKFFWQSTRRDCSIDTRW